MANFGIDEIIAGDEPSRPSTLLVLLIMAVPIFATIVFGGVDNVTWILLTLTAVLMITLWLIDTRGASGFLFSSNSLQLPLIALILIGLVQILPVGSIVFEDQSLSISTSLSMDPNATRSFVSRLVVYAIFLAACSIYVNAQSRLKTIALVTVVFGALIAFFGILQRLSGAEGIYGLRATSGAISFGPFVNQDHFAALMEMTAGVTLGMLFSEHLKKDKKVLLAIALVIMGCATLLTGSRGGVVGMLSMAGVVGLLNLLLRRRGGRRARSDARQGLKRKAALGFAGVAIVLVILGVVVFIGGNDYLLRSVGAVNASPDFSTGRTHFWPIALRIFLDHPIIGAGFDAFGVAYTRYDTWNGLLRVEQAHNDYLQTLADAGILGFAAIAAFVYLLFKRGMSIIFGRDSQTRDLVIGALAGCFGILVHSFFDFPLRTPANAFFFLLLCSVATSRISREA